jgi:hypothetical protein
MLDRRIDDGTYICHFPAFERWFSNQPRGGAAAVALSLSLLFIFSFPNDNFGFFLFIYLSPHPQERDGFLV